MLKVVLFSCLYVHAVGLKLKPQDWQLPLNIDHMENGTRVSDEEMVYVQDDNDLNLHEKGHCRSENPSICHKRLQRASKGLQYALGCDRSDLKVALCINGLARKFTASEQSLSFQSHIIQPLSKAGARGIQKDTPPDVFVHVTLGKGKPASDREHTSVNTVSDQVFIPTKEHFMQAMEDIHPTNYTVVEGFGAGYDYKALGDESCFTQNCNGDCRRPMAYFYAMQKCYEQVEAKENESGSKYDFVIFTRPDFELFGENEYVKSVQCKKSLFVTDHTSLVLREHADALGNIWKTQFANPHPDMCKKNGISGEAFIQRAMQDMKGDKVYAR